MPKLLAESGRGFRPAGVSGGCPPLQRPRPHTSPEEPSRTSAKRSGIATMHRIGRSTLGSERRLQIFRGHRAEHPVGKDGVQALHGIAVAVDGSIAKLSLRRRHPKRRRFAASTRDLPHGARIRSASTACSANVGEIVRACSPKASHRRAFSFFSPLCSTAKNAGFGFSSRSISSG